MHYPIFKYFIIICIPFCCHFKTGSQYIQLNYLNNKILNFNFQVVFHCQKLKISIKNER